MKKWLIAFFLLLITSFSIIGLINGNDVSGVKVEQNMPDNSNTGVVQ
ncbi:hypothetical protein [Aquibacillus salsiterrae]|uniref:Uncharacterized protein n=1 Tax=Aquibacillus salsiterrae TaxID=2950439 RepID=A0A9X4AHE6_9BACI|nr:hypothetical protein [Aquibacillus salsiterrae]MDC3418118.1 hypothetical protein [Aquibacillus salsiterrae]